MKKLFLFLLISGSLVNATNDKVDAQPTTESTKVVVSEFNEVADLKTKKASVKAVRSYMWKKIYAYRKACKTEMAFKLAITILGAEIRNAFESNVEICKAANEIEKAATFKRTWGETFVTATKWTALATGAAAVGITAYILNYVDLDGKQANSDTNSN